MSAKSRKGKRMQMFSQVTVPPTPERWAKGEMQLVEVKLFDERNMATMDLRASMLDRYWRDNLLLGNTNNYQENLDIAAARHAAGQKLAQLFEATGLRQRETGAYEPRSNAYQDTTDHPDKCKCQTCKQLGAWQAYQGVVRLLQASSLGAASAVINLCVYEFDPVDRAALIHGLDLLVRHWGLD